jgi:membrane protease YdiL (CAAX protease family)
MLLLGNLVSLGDGVMRLGFFLSEIITIMGAVFLWKTLIGLPLRDMGFEKFRTGYKNLLFGLLFGAVSMTSVFAVLYALGSVQLSGSLREPRIGGFLLWGIVFYTAVGFAEEMIARAFFIKALSRRFKTASAVVISSIIFSVMHFGNSGISIPAAINLFLIGLLFAQMYVQSGSLWVPIGYHITWNYFQGYIFGFQVSGNVVQGMYNTSAVTKDIINGGSFGPEGGLVVTAVIIFGYAVTHFAYKSKM